jgi:A/G-specific adenine glycosylase
MSAKSFPAIRRKLLRWYDKNQRALPWRRTRDPYAIWIAEIMLQQTQVKTALPYYERFLGALPSVETLARAPLSRVLRLWSGLGYYRRAENLRTAARQILRDHRGKIPDDYGQLRALAGIGDYTAGAILSIAFGKNYPAVDGNVRRVLGRLGRITKESALRAAAANLAGGARPGDLNQALMELGATVCAPLTPNCAACPLKLECLSLAGGPLARRAARRRAKNFTDVTWPLAVVRHRGKILLRRRAATRLLARLWELPGVETARPERALRALRRSNLPRHVLLAPYTTASPTGASKRRSIISTAPSHLKSPCRAPDGAGPPREIWNATPFRR